MMNAGAAHSATDWAAPLGWVAGTNERFIFHRMADDAIFRDAREAMFNVVRPVMPLAAEHLVRLSAQTAALLATGRAARSAVKLVLAEVSDE